MARPREAGVRTRTLGDGSITYWAKVTVGPGDRRPVILGSSRDGMNHDEAQKELERVQAQVVLGQWEDPRAQTPADEITFHVFASEWYAGKKLALSPNGADYNEWALTHLLPFFGPYRLADIDIPAVDLYVRHKLAERAEIVSRLAAGERLVDDRNQPIKPLLNSTINKTLKVLSEILKVAREYGLIQTNPAAGKARRLKVIKRRQTWLMPDQALDMIDAAERIDRKNKPETREKAERLQALRAGGMMLKQAAHQLGLRPPTANYLAGLKLTAREVSVRRAIIATLLLAGLRVTELCALQWQDIDFVNRRINLPGTKTGAADRWIKITDFLLVELQRWRHDAPDTSPEALVFPSPNGKARTKDTVREDVIKPALAEANRLRLVHEIGPITGAVTPHTCRRTFVALRLAHREDVKSVQRQAGHEDSRTTLDIYGEVMKSELGETDEQVAMLCAYTTERRLRPPGSQHPELHPAPRPTRAGPEAAPHRSRTRPVVTFSASGYAVAGGGTHAVASRVGTARSDSPYSTIAGTGVPAHESSVGRQASEPTRP